MCTRHCPFATSIRKKSQHTGIKNNGNILHSSLIFFMLNFHWFMLSNFDSMQTIIFVLLTFVKWMQATQWINFRCWCQVSWNFSLLETDLSHKDLSSLDEHRWAGDVESLLETFQVQHLHLLITALHLHRVEGQHGNLVHVLGTRREGGYTQVWVFIRCVLKMDLTSPSFSLLLSFTVFLLTSTSSRKRTSLTSENPLLVGSMRASRMELM